MLERAVFTTAMSSISIAVASETTARVTLRVIELFSVREGMWQRLAEQAFAVRTAHRPLGVRLSLVRSPQCLGPGCADLPQFGQVLPAQAVKERHRLSVRLDLLWLRRAEEHARHDWVRQG